MPPMTHYGYCDAVGKLAYTDRKLARANARRLHPGESLSAYRCEHGDHWHIGHRRSRLLAEVIGQELLSAPGGVVTFDRLRDLAEDTITVPQGNLPRTSSSRHLAAALRRLHYAGAVVCDLDTVTLRDALALRSCVEAFRTEQAGAA